MANSFSDYLENKVLGHVFGGSAYSAPVTIYVGLFTADPGESGSSNEVSGNGYLRQSMAFTVSGSAAANTSAVEFPTATGSWGTVTHTALYDASTSGNMLAVGQLSASKSIGTNDVFRFNAGDFDITID
jgi:hypothetical protein